MKDNEITADIIKNEEALSAERAAELCEVLRARGLRISFAESCTGGLAAATLVGISGSSDVFDASFVTYANEAKIKYLGVSPAAIEKYGVVSETVAREMAEGAARANGAEVGVGISGIAGPTGGTAEKPVGTVCFGFFVDGTLSSSTVRFGNIGRNAVRQKSVSFVYETLLSLLAE